MSKTICNNCGKQGHQFHQCKLPITSYGIILFRSSTNGIEFLMLRRKNSFGYIDFIRGKYVQNNISLGAGAEAKAVAGSRKKIPGAGAAPKTGRL